MIDKGLWIFVTVLITLLGLGAVAFVWAQQIPLIERVLASFVGLVGPSWVITHTLSNRSSVVKQ